MRQAERAIFDLRRGLPVLLRDHGQDTLIQAVEGLADDSLAAAQALTGTAGRLVLSRHRMAALGHADPFADRSIALIPQPDSAGLRELAWTRGAELPAGAGLNTANATEQAALRLLGRGQLVPAAMAFAVTGARAGTVANEVASGNLLAVDCADVVKLCEHGAGTLTRVSEAAVPLAEAETTRFVLFREADGIHEHVAIVIGERASWPEAVPVRVHSSCLTGDLFGSLRCDCGEQLRRGVAAIRAQGGGILLYLSQEGRGIGLANKLRAYGLQDLGLDTIDADQVIGFSKDERNFRVAHQMLDDLGVSKVLLLTNNPAKVEALQRAGINVVARQAIYGEITAQNLRYLHTKANRHGHWLHDLLDEQDEPDTPARLPASRAGC